MKPNSAPVSCEIAPKPVAQPSRSLVAFRLTESQAAKLGLRDRWLAAVKKREMRADKKRQAIDRLTEMVSRLLDRAQEEHWSQRQLAARIQIPETTFRRIRNGNVIAEEWLPKIEAALARLNMS